MTVVRLHVALMKINNNNEYLERLTRTGPKRLHDIYKYILSKFNAHNMNAHTQLARTVRDQMAPTISEDDERPK